MSLTKLSLGIIKLFPARDILVSDSPARDGDIDSLFYSALPYMMVFSAQLAAGGGVRLPPLDLKRGRGATLSWG